MKRSTVPATLAILGLLMFAHGVLRAQGPVDPYPALSRGAVDYAAMIAGNTSGASDLYLTEINDYGGVQYGFTLDKGESAAWGYIFYSPSLDSSYVVLVAGQNNTIFATIYAGSYGRPDSVPVALDTSGAFSPSAKLAEMMRSNADYQAYINRHPEATGILAVHLTSAPETFGYPRPAGFPAGPVWMAITPAIGDSLHVCMLATSTGLAECADAFSVTIPHSFAISTLGTVRFGTSNFGMFASIPTQQGVEAGFEAPDGSGNTYIYGAGLWFGARKRVGDSIVKRVFITYDPNSGASWATPGEGYAPRSTYSSPVLANAASHDPLTGRPQLEGPASFNWPLWVVAPDTGATMMDPGTFIALNTDRTAGGSVLRPAYVPGTADQFVARYHDALLTAYAGSTVMTGFPLGLQIQENVYSQPGGLDNTVILSYEVVNKSDDTLFDAVAGMLTDFDLGNALNDRSRFYSERPELRTALAYTGSEGSRPTPYGILAMTLLEAPVTGESGRVDGTRRAEYRTTGAVNSYRTWTIQTDSVVSLTRYDFMTSGRKDADTRAADLRGLLTSQPFTMYPGDTAHFAIAYLVNRGLAAQTAADPVLEQRITNVINAYYGLQFSGIRGAESRDGALSIVAAPNPARESVALRLDVRTRGDATLEIFDHLGQRVLLRELGTLEAGRSIRSIDVAGLAGGAYVVVARCGDARVSTPLVIAR